MFGGGIINFGPGVSTINGVGGAIVFAGVSGIFIDRQGQTIYIGMSGINEIAYTNTHYSPTVDVDSVLCDASGFVTSPLVITLKDAKIDATAGTVMLSGINGAKIDQHNTVLLTTQGESLSIICSRSQYWII
jgi:hypothetical protein